MKKSFPLMLFVFLLGATALWYFEIQRPSQKMLNSKPKTIYKTTTSVRPKSPPVMQDSTVPITVEHGNETQIESLRGTENVAIDTTAETRDTVDHSEHKGSDENTQVPYEQEVSEQEHSHEHPESDDSKELIEEASIALEEAAELQEEAYIVLANQLKALPAEEQLVMLEEMKGEFINAQNPLNGAPMFDSPEEARVYWLELFEGLSAAGYTPPAGFKK